jgi:hypothetical protein
VFVRQDFPKDNLAQQIVQSNHATFEMAKRLTNYGEIPSLVLIGTPDKTTLEAIAERLQRYGIDYEAFYESDNGTGLSAIATYPITKNKQRHALGMYRLWTAQEASYATV